MKSNAGKISSALGAVIALAAVFPASAQIFKQTNLVSDQPGMGAALVDPNLVNPWGVSHSGSGPFWVSDAGTQLSTIYSVDANTGVVANTGLVVSIPGPPSGQVFNGSSSDFLLGPGAPALFIFAGLNGVISGWNPNFPAAGSNVATPKAALGGAYTGIAMGMRPSGRFLYAANPAFNRIDVFDSNFVPTPVPGGFAEPNPISGVTPFNIANINGDLFVSYAPSGGLVFGPGYINVFDTDGNFKRRFATGGTLLSPWGMALAPAGFGPFGNALLVGNFNLGNSALGQGYISAFDLGSGAFLGLLKGSDGNPLSIDGLWQLIFGNNGSGGNANVLYFAAGIQGQAHGLFGSLSACGGAAISGASANPNVLWPPNNKFVPVTVDYSVSSDCSNAAPVCALSVTNNETGAADATVVNDHVVELRASRDGKGDGRVYTITIACHDSLSQSSNATVTVTVPHDQGH